MDFDFPERLHNEHVIMVIRKHFIVYLRLVAAFVFIFILPIVILFWLMANFSPVANNLEVLLNFGIFSCVYFLYGLIFLAIAWIDEEFDLFILTNQRLIDMTQENIFKRTVASTALEHIQDSTSKVEGIFQTILNYGNVDVQTAAGNASAFEIDRVPQPDAVSQAILSAAEYAYGGHQGGERPPKPKFSG